MEVVNYPRNWSSLFSGNKLVCAPDAYNAKTFQIQTMWIDALKASIFGSDGSNNTKHHNFIQVLCPFRNYHFDDACVYFTKDVDGYSFIQHLLQLPTIQSEWTYNLLKMTKV